MTVEIKNEAGVIAFSNDLSALLNYRKVAPVRAVSVSNFNDIPVIIVLFGDNIGKELGAWAVAKFDSFIVAKNFAEHLFAAHLEKYVEKDGEIGWKTKKIQNLCV